MAKMPEIEIDVAPARTAGVDIAQYLGAWAIEPLAFERLVGQVKNMDWSAHLAAAGERDISAVKSERRTLAAGSRETRIALVEISGVMTKRGSSMSDAGSMTRARRELRQLADSDEVDAIILRIDSPGGTVAGTADLGRAVREAAARKPLTAFVEDLAASAAYWVASQATRIIANNETAKVGSIGVLLATYDLSRLAANQGIEPVVIATGPLKGTGFPGAEITEEQRANLRELVAEDFDEFKAVIARGRSLSLKQVSALATGGVFSATTALENGLIDGIQSLEAAIEDLAAAVGGGRTQGGRSAVATYQEIVESCAGIDPAEEAEDAQFLCDQQRGEATAETAGRAWAQTLKARADSAREELDSARAEAVKTKTAAAKAEPIGVDPVEELAGERRRGGSAREEFFAQVEAKVEKGARRDKAIRAVVHAEPELHRAMIAESDGGRDTAA